MNFFKYILKKTKKLLNKEEKNVDILKYILKKTKKLLNKEEKKEVIIIKSNSIDEERMFLLKKTAQAFNSGIALNFLRSQARKYRITQKGKMIKSGHIYQDELINQISDIIYEYIPNTKFWKISIRRIFRDMDECNFKNQPSMNRINNSDYLNFFKDEIEEKLNCYESINLTQHTLNVLNVFNAYFKGNLTYINIPTFEILMACLLHDFGKSRQLQVNICKSNDFSIKHQDVSSLYIHRIKNDLSNEYLFINGEKDEDLIFGLDELEKIRVAVINHHNDVDKGSLADLLKIVDHKTREMEYIEYERHRKKFTRSSIIKI
ncbi:hypothetical protein [Aliarcobacter butzleri]|uniref:hypothetical protein n=1 Tax=Aliarcobacter butzleri TaxID=28197 RepID=UPI00344F16E7